MVEHGVYRIIDDRHDALPVIVVYIDEVGLLFKEERFLLFQRGLHHKTNDHHQMTVVLTVDIEVQVSFINILNSLVLLVEVMIVWLKDLVMVGESDLFILLKGHCNLCTVLHLLMLKLILWLSLQLLVLIRVRWDYMRIIRIRHIWIINIYNFKILFIFFLILLK